jgi:hypothetical protein
MEIWMPLNLPRLKTLTEILGQLLSTTVNSSNSTLLTALGSNLKFIDVSKINLNDVKLRSPSKMKVNVNHLIREAAHENAQRQSDNSLVTVAN